MDSREDHHWLVVVETTLRTNELTWVNVCDLLIHIKEVTVTLTDLVDTEALDRLREVEEYGKTCVVYTKALVTTLLSSTRSYVTRYEVTECWVTALEVVVTILLWNIPTLLCTSLESLSILKLLRYPDTTIVTQRL